MKIATWNVNSLKVRLPHVLDWLAATGTDVLALQETKLTDDKFPVAEIEAAGYRVAFSGQKTYNGVAILSRLPITDAGDRDYAQLGHARKEPVGAALEHAVKAAIAQQQGAFVFLHSGALEHLHQHLFFLFLLRCRHSSHIGLPLQRWRGARGHSLGRAVRRGGCPIPSGKGGSTAGCGRRLCRVLAQTATG